MYRNDYRRALIMLRPVLSKGMSGHVRLERRTLMGTMRFSVSGADPNDAQNALLMADTARGWVTYPLGALNMDSRGQSGMIASFDPRDLNGLDLNDYTLVALVRTGEGEPDLSMTGFVNGSREVNWAQAREAARTSYRTGAVQTGDTARTEEAARTQRDQAPQEDVALVLEVASEPPDCDCEAEADDQPFEPLEPASESATPDTRTAAEVLELDENAVWTEDIAPLRVLFFASRPTAAFQLTDFVFVDAPLPGEDGADGVCAIGLKAQDGQPVSVCYALPGEFAMEPPPGLEGYEYAGGWWFTVLEIVT